MKRLIGLTLLCILAVSLAGPAFAWEYHMKGETVWRYRYLSRTGNNDVFGRVGGATILTVVHTDRRGAVRIISARAASRAERRRYDEALRKGTFSGGIG